MHSKDTVLTYTALGGKRKQDVGDAERLLSLSVAEFLNSKGYKRESNYFLTIHNWHMASDGRGLSQLQRCRYNYAMLNLILSELMPWHVTTYDFSKLDVNRYCTLVYILIAAQNG